MSDEIVYFVRCGPYVKIGKSTNAQLANRLSDLQVGSPDPHERLGILRDGSGAESRIQAQWAHLRRRGEWFVLTPNLAKFIIERCPGAPDDLIKVARWYCERGERIEQPAFMQIRTMLKAVFRA